MHTHDKTFSKEATNLFHFFSLSCRARLKPDVIHVTAKLDLTALDHVVRLALYS